MSCWTMRRKLGESVRFLKRTSRRHMAQWIGVFGLYVGEVWFLFKMERLDPSVYVYQKSLGF